MIEKIVFESNDGQVFNSKIECIHHEGNYVCPKCKSLGTVKGRYNAYPSGLPDSGWVDDWKYKDVTCNVCNGKGYTETKLKPIIKVVGYE